MRLFRPSVVLSVILLAGSSGLRAESTPAAAAAPLAGPRARISPHETISAVIGDRRTGDRITLTYGRPYTKDPKTGAPRKIWGSLVAWDKADRLGADEATLLITQQPLVFGETTLPAGAYTLYVVPAETGPSKLAFSSNLGKWGVPVDETHDVTRVALTKTPLEKTVDQLTLGIENNDAGGVLKIQWEDTQLSVSFTVKK